MTLRTDCTLKEDAKDNLKSYLKIAPFSFSVTPYPHADVGRGQGAPEPHKLGATGSIARCPQPAPRPQTGPWATRLPPGPVSSPAPQSTPSHNRHLLCFGGKSHRIRHTTKFSLFLQGGTSSLCTVCKYREL